MFHFATQNLTTVYTTNTVPDSDLESGFLCGVVRLYESIHWNTDTRQNTMDSVRASFWCI